MADADEQWNLTNPPAAPSITVLGVLPDGTRLIKPDWGSAKPVLLGERALGNLENLGIIVHDKPADYLF